jgi:hypothetical protein
VKDEDESGLALIQGTSTGLTVRSSLCIILCSSSTGTVIDPHPRYPYTSTLCYSLMIC